MAKIGRNSPCPCGSGKKYKHCCEERETEIRRSELPSGRFRNEFGSYGGPGRGYMPSILCYKQIGPDIAPRRGRQWTWAPAKPRVVPKGVKDEVSTMTHQLVEAELKRAYVQPPPKNPRWNYIVDIFTKWRGRYFYLMARYACPGPNAISPFFETGLARLEFLSNGQFNVAYMRHTGEWWQVRTDMALASALQAIGSEPIFHP